MTVDEEIARTLDQHHHVYDSDRGMDLGCFCGAVDEYKSDEEHAGHLAQILAPLLNRVRAEALREAADDLSASARGSAALQRAHDIAEGVTPTGTSTPNEAEWYQMGNWARSTLLAFADRIEQNSEGNET